MTLLMVIGMSYSVTAPLVTAVALVGFSLFWFVYKVSASENFPAIILDSDVFLKSVSIPLCVRHAFKW